MSNSDEWMSADVMDPSDGKEYHINCEMNLFPYATSLKQAKGLRYQLVFHFLVRYDGGDDRGEFGIYYDPIREVFAKASSFTDLKDKGKDVIIFLKDKYRQILSAPEPIQWMDLENAVKIPVAVSCFVSMFITEHFSE
jgi:hypothetical protein